jgi:hypothetical protein
MEQISHLVLSSTEETNVKQKVEKFVSGLFLQGSSSNCPSLSAIDGVVNNIDAALKIGTEITLLGSYITLPRVRVLDPVKIRKDAKISNELKQQSRDHYVLTEAILGGAFFGFGIRTSKIGHESDETERGKDIRAITSRISTMSFISQGAIPKINKSAEKVSLWDVYTSWKEVLEEDHSGYPVGVRFRNLWDILEEENVPGIPEAVERSDSILIESIANFEDSPHFLSAKKKDST